MLKTQIIKAPLNLVFNAIAEGNLFRATDILEDTFRFDFKEGGQYAFSWPEAGRCEGTFEKIQPNRQVIFTWIKSEAEYTNESIETRVSIELRSITDGTELALNHTGFKNDDAYQSHNEGWDYVLNEFAKSVAN